MAPMISQTASMTGRADFMTYHLPRRMRRDFSGDRTQPAKYRDNGRLNTLRVSIPVLKRSLLDVFLDYLRGGRRRVVHHHVLDGQVVRVQVRNGLRGRLAHRHISGLAAVGFLAGGTGVEHDVRGKAGFVDLAYDAAPRPPAQDRPPAHPAGLVPPGK